MQHHSANSTSYTEMVYHRGVWMTREDRNKLRPQNRSSLAGIVVGVLLIIGLLVLLAPYAPRL
jgi:hypothetical protein